MTKLPDDLPVIERNVVRLVVQDVLGRVLLFRTRELSMPELRYWWELPGGGIEEGESYVRDSGTRVARRGRYQCRARPGRPSLVAANSVVSAPQLPSSTA